ncbi:MAG TPA: hypothetical protein VFV43_03250 [Limnobacter sp.]|nr:hypothetical protein [Limnobacter sp.]
MFDLPKPGVYVVRAPHVDGCTMAMVEHWLLSQEETRYKACLWLTAIAQNVVRDLLQTHMRKRRAPKGLDVISIRELIRRSLDAGGIRALCRSLDTLRVLDPTLVIVEYADLWFKSADMPLDQRNAMDQMRLLHQWALHANAHVLLPVQNDLPTWSVFADGLADVDAIFQFDFRPWWPTAYGLHSSLWNEPDSLPELPVHHVVDADHCESIGQLARLCHSLRFSEPGSSAIHVLGRHKVNEQDASVLLRLGADTVLTDGTQLSSWVGVPETRLQALDTGLMPPHIANPHFARDLHEVFMPGMLTVLPMPEFSRQGLMLLKLAKRWHVHCSLARLSLMPHMTARTALKLINWNASACAFTASREALYAIKLWPLPPSDQDFRDWLEACFREPLAVLFSGDVVFSDAQQEDLLHDLHEELEPLQITDLLDDDLQEPDLEALWGDESHATQERPWTNRLNTFVMRIRA